MYVPNWQKSLLEILNWKKKVFFKKATKLQVVTKLRWHTFSLSFPTLESGIDVAPWLNEASGKFDKENKRSPLKFANLCSKIWVF